MDQLVSEHHQVRCVWSYVCSLDLTQFYVDYQAVDGRAGRQPVDPRIIVGVSVSSEGTDSGQMKPMLDQVESDFGERPEEMLADGGYNSREDVTEVEQHETAVFSPVRKARNSDRDPHERRPGDSDEAACWRERMATEEAKEIYKESKGDTD